MSNIYGKQNLDHNKVQERSEVTLRNIYISLIAVSMFVLLSGCWEQITSAPDAGSKRDVFFVVLDGERKQAFIEDVTINEAEKLIQSKQSLVVLDIRTPAEFKREHIANAINVDFYASDFREKLSKLDRATPYLVHCATGVRSSKSIKIFKALSFLAIYHMKAGFTGWKAAGKPTTR